MFCQVRNRVDGVLALGRGNSSSCVGHLLLVVAVNRVAPWRPIRSLVGRQVVDGDGLVTVGAWPSGPDVSTPGVAVVAAAFVDVTVVALGALVDDVVRGW